MAGILSANKQYPFMFRGTSLSDLNMSIESGYYRLAGSYTNSPIAGLYGELIVFKDTTSYGVQICIDNSISSIWFRGFVHSEGLFYDWKKII